ISPVGSEGGILTAFRQKDNSIMVNRGCFSETIEEFEEAVNQTHGENKHGQVYRALIQVIKFQLDEISVTEDSE
ncbi:TPA: hypothetical protein N2G38_005632, partial [Salmonella enterica]|nr:hypothetical protein [Salmonella enterica]